MGGRYAVARCCYASRSFMGSVSRYVGSAALERNGYGRRGYACADRPPRVDIGGDIVANTTDASVAAAIAPLCPAYGYVQVASWAVCATHVSTAACSGNCTAARGALVHIDPLDAFVLGTVHFSDTSVAARHGHCHAHGRFQCMRTANHSGGSGSGIATSSHSALARDSTGRDEATRQSAIGPRSTGTGPHEPTLTSFAAQ